MVIPFAFATLDLFSNLFDKAKNIITKLSSARSGHKTYMVNNNCAKPEKSLAIAMFGIVKINNTLKMRFMLIPSRA